LLTSASSKVNILQLNTTIKMHICMYNAYAYYVCGSRCIAINCAKNYSKMCFPSNYSYMVLLTVLSKVSLYASLFVNIIVVSMYNLTVLQELSM
jgi:hypothetical protein